MAMGDFNFSARVVEAIRKIASAVVLEIYPLPRAATVTAVDHVAGTATVTYPGDSTSVVVATTMYAPNVGSVVMISGPPGTRYVSEVLTGGTHLRT
jgi:altronate dehydratase